LITGYQKAKYWSLLPIFVSCSKVEFTLNFGLCVLLNYELKVVSKPDIHGNDLGSIVNGIPFYTVVGAWKRDSIKCYIT
jgi:hypothetical protein